MWPVESITLFLDDIRVFRKLPKVKLILFPVPMCFLVGFFFFPIIFPIERCTTFFFFGNKMITMGLKEVYMEACKFA